MNTSSLSVGIDSLLGGGLRANDPRRYLVEMMVGAMHADGHVDPRELETLERLLGEHDLFVDLPGPVRLALVDSAREAIVIAGGLDERLERTALALPWRLHRLAAYAMACELVAADSIITCGEEDYLRVLRRRLVVDQAESVLLLEAARADRTMTALGELASAAASLAPKAMRICVTELSAIGRFDNDAVNRLDDAFSRMIDFSRAARVPRDQIERMSFELASSPSDRCLEIVSRIGGVADRYWSITYALAAGDPDRWRNRPIYNLLRLGFEMSERAMDRSAAHAAALRRAR